MINKLNQIQEEALIAISKATSQVELNDLKAYYMGKKSPLGEIMKGMATLSIEEKKSLGMKANEVKKAIEEAINQKRKEIEEAEDREDYATNLEDVESPAHEILPEPTPEEGNEEYPLDEEEDDEFDDDFDDEDLEPDEEDLEDFDEEGADI